MIFPDTIVAPATPHGYGGISVVRISGPKSKNIVLSFLKKQKSKKLNLKHKKAAFAHLFFDKNTPLDDVVILFFKKPHSYTGEDVVEISCHGNPSIVNKIVSLCCSRGSRLAEPGEFTKRAFLNGKMDLIQAEAVASLINSKTAEGAALNARLLSGGLSLFFDNIKNGLVSLLAKIEFELDINEGDYQPLLKKNASTTLNKTLSDIKSALDSHAPYRMISEGARVVICGKPNVGKSTILNALSGTSRSIIDNSPGTTRDTVELSFSLLGTPVTLIDTAGIRKTANPIEKKGILRSKKQISSADLVLFILEPEDTNAQLVSLKKGTPSLCVINKTDLYTKKENSSLKKLFPDMVFVSAKNGKGIDILLKKIGRKICPSLGASSQISTATLRQTSALKKISKNIKRASLLLNNKECPHELVAFELRDALSLLDGVLGKTYTEDILSEVFKSFCVGK